jgi:hypothetical protein
MEVSELDVGTRDNYFLLSNLDLFLAFFLVFWQTLKNTKSRDLAEFCLEITYSLKTSKCKM